MRILHVIDKIDPEMGGVSQAVRTMVSGLSALFNENEVVTFDNPDASFLNHTSCTIHALGVGKSPWSYNSKLRPWLLKNFSRFDVIIVHGLWLYQTYAVTKAIQKYKTQKDHLKISIPKVYIMPHGMLDPYFQKAEGRKLKAFRNLVYWKLIEKDVVNKSDGLLFTCEEECALARCNFKPYDPKEEIVVGLGVEDPPRDALYLREAFYSICSVTEDSNFVLFIGRIDPKKGVDLLIHAYYEVFHSKKSTLKHSTLKRGKESLEVGSVLPKLVIAGPGLETAYGQSIQNLVDQYNLTSSVIFTGMLSGDAKWGAFYGCEVFALPSHQENFGIAVVEALACSKPVLISNKINIFREIEAGGGGIVAEDSLGGIIDLFSRWNDMSLYEKEDMAKRARHVFLKNFAIGPVAKQLMASLV